MAKEKKYILTIDQGTTSCRTIIFDKLGKTIGINQLEFSQFYPDSGWVEHNPIEILNTQITTIMAAKRDSGVFSEEIAAIAITNQRETIVAWDKTTGHPIYNAIVWQDQRTAPYCQELKDKGYEKKFHEKTGLTLNPYFSGTKLRWILKNSEKAKEVLKAGNLIAGTIDSWLIWNLTGGKVHATDVSNASRTLLYNIHTHSWDEEILKILEIPKEILPEVRPSSSDFGMMQGKFFAVHGGSDAPITGVAGDQQAALFGQLCTNVGDVKNTYGTGCFTLINTGTKPVDSKNNLLTTIAWQLKNEEPVYALEGSVFIAGAAIQWLRDAVRLIYNSKESDILASLVKDKTKVYFVPSFTGLGAPYWDSYSRGAIFGLERGTGREHIVRATLEAIAYQTNDLINAMAKDLGKPLRSLKVDGGAANSEYIMQFQSNISNIKVEKPLNLETTALGATFLAGLSINFWKSISEIQKIRVIDKTYTPSISIEEREENIHGWNEAVKRTMNWTKAISKNKA